MLACPLFLNLKTIAALVNYSGAPSARVAPYLRKLVIHLSEKFGNRVTVSPYVRTDREGKWRDSGVSPSGGRSMLWRKYPRSLFMFVSCGHHLWFNHNRLWLMPGEFNMAVIKQKHSRTRKKTPPIKTRDGLNREIFLITSPPYL